jgi:hypothetical protein
MSQQQKSTADHANSANEQEYEELIKQVVWSAKTVAIPRVEANPSHLPLPPSTFLEGL